MIKSIKTVVLTNNIGFKHGNIPIYLHPRLHIYNPHHRRGNLVFARSVLPIEGYPRSVIKEDGSEATEFGFYGDASKSKMCSRAMRITRRARQLAKRVERMRLKNLRKVRSAGKFAVAADLSK